MCRGHCTGQPLKAMQTGHRKVGLLGIGFMCETLWSFWQRDSPRCDAGACWLMLWPALLSLLLLQLLPG